MALIKLNKRNNVTFYVIAPRFECRCLKTAVFKATAFQAMPAAFSYWGKILNTSGAAAGAFASEWFAATWCQAIKCWAANYPTPVAKKAQTADLNHLNAHECPWSHVCAPTY
jgi:hypothetical protein